MGWVLSFVFWAVVFCEIRPPPGFDVYEQLVFLLVLWGLAEVVSRNPECNANESGDGIDHWNGVQSGMSVLFYCNDAESDGLDGGETRLWSADGSRHVDVAPRKGRALFFRRGSRDAVLHAGLPVRGAVPKYMALINLAYGERVGTARLTL